jgi:hypothetical protein
MKSELKQERYGLSKIQGPRGEDWKLPGTLLRKPRGIYIIIYINSRALLAKGPEWMESGESKRFKGLLEVWQDTRKDLGLLKRTRA